MFENRPPDFLGRDSCRSLYCNLCNAVGSFSVAEFALSIFFFFESHRLGCGILDVEVLMDVCKPLDCFQSD